MPRQTDYPSRTHKHHISCDLERLSEAVPPPNGYHFPDPLRCPKNSLNDQRRVLVVLPPYPIHNTEILPPGREASIDVVHVGVEGGRLDENKHVRIPVRGWWLSNRSRSTLRPEDTRWPFCTGRRMRRQTSGRDRRTVALRRNHSRCGHRTGCPRYWRSLRPCAVLQRRINWRCGLRFRSAAPLHWCLGACCHNFWSSGRRDSGCWTGSGRGRRTANLLSPGRPRWRTVQEQIWPWL